MIAYNIFGIDACLIASKAKSLSSSLLSTLAQVVQHACDSAVFLLTKFRRKWPNSGISYLDIVVPFITTSWNDVQFRAVYLMEPCYPCAILLSRKLCFDSGEDVYEMWIIALSRHCLRVNDVLYEAIRESGSASKARAISDEPPAKRSKVTATDEESEVLPRKEQYLNKPIILPTDCFEAKPSNFALFAYESIL